MSYGNHLANISQKRRGLSLVILVKTAKKRKKKVVSEKAQEVSVRYEQIVACCLSEVRVLETQVQSEDAGSRGIFYLTKTLARGAFAAAAGGGNPARPPSEPPPLEKPRGSQHDARGLRRAVTDPGGGPSRSPPRSCAEQKGPSRCPCSGHEDAVACGG